MTTVFLCVIAVYGLLLGSFCAALGSRGTATSRLWRTSRCDHCASRVLWYDLVPVISFLLLRGRCRTCHCPISWVYPVVEAGTASLAVLVYACEGRSWETLVTWLALGVLAALCASDFMYLKLPDRYLYPGVAVTFALRMWIHPLGLLTYESGALVGYLFLYAVFRVSRGGIGYGDVKLFILVGLLVGVYQICTVILLASLLALVAVGMMQVMGRWRPSSKLPFAPPIALASVATSLYGHVWVVDYLHLALHGAG